MNRPILHSDALRGPRRALLRLWFAALALCCAAACERDGLPGDPSGAGGGDDAEAVAWVVFEAAPGPGLATRADETTDHGTEDEYALAPGNYHFILLYRKSNLQKPEAVIPLQSPSVIADRPNADATKKLVAVYGLKEAQAEGFKEFLQNFEALALLNFDPVQLGLDNNGDLGDWANIDPENITVPRNDLLGKVLGSADGNALEASIVVGGTRYYTMTSSVYVDKGSVVYGWETQTNELFDSKQKAISAALNGRANIATYVERVVAKVVPFFSYEPGRAGERYLKRQDPDNTKINLFVGLTDDGRFDVRTVQRHWNAKVVGYGINGLEHESRLFKKVESRGYPFQWNNPDSRRSYWAEDTHYAVNSDDEMRRYPHQYRTALEVDTLRDYHRTTTTGYPRLLTYTQDGYGSVDHIPEWEDTRYFSLDFNVNNSRFYLRYVSFDELKQAEVSSDAEQKAFYPLENTYADPDGRLGPRGYFTAGTHLLVACQLEIEGLTPGEDLYKDQNDIFYDDMETLLMAKFDLIVNKALPGGNSGLNILHVDWLNHNPEGKYVTSLSWPVGSKLYIDRNNNGNWHEWMDEADWWLDLTLIPAELTGGDGQLLIAPKWHDNYFAIATDLESARLPENKIDYNEIVSLFHKLVGPIDHYRYGYMYYAAPVGHNAKTSDEWQSTQVGSVGVVRNHSYQLQVNSVSQPGRSVDMTGQPIIPLLDVKRDYIDVSVKILDWHGIYHDDIPRYPQQ